MNKIEHTSRDILGGNVEKIAQLFPGVVTEAQDEATGELKKVVDFDLLRQHLSDELVEGDRERFRLDWPGKKASILKANTPIHKTLRPVREDSEDFDTTQNVFIEGDNFEVLKVLQESYLGKIKMIYIDPPYNTGKDFIYRDNFTQDREDYEEEIGVRDDENGGKLVKNTETNGRYHSDWLSMMQERLIVARDLLTDDGVIFISIDDNEQANLKKLGDEVFGENNFISAFKWNKTSKAPTLSKLYRSKYEYLLAYQKGGRNTLRGQASYNTAGPLLNAINKYSLVRFAPGMIECKFADGSYPAGAYGKDSSRVEIKNDVIVKDGYNSNEVVITARFKWTQSTVDERFKEGQSYAFKKPNFATMYYSLDNEDGSKFIAPSDIINSEEAGVLRNDDAFNELGKLMGKLNVFDYTKPVSLIKYLVNMIHESNDFTILDFFSGSGTTAHAVMQLNAEDGGNRKHIQVQLAEPTDEGSEAYKAGYKSIPEISRERIRRAGKKIREDYAEKIAKRDTPLDTGFRAYKLASSNFKDTAKHPDQIDQTSLLADTDNIKTDRTADDLLTEVILSLGLTLDLPIETRDIAGHTVYFVGGNSLVACFDDSVSLDIVDDIALEKPLRVVFKDSSFASDETRINIDIRLKQLSPDTTVQVV